MNPDEQAEVLEKLTVIVNRGLGSKVLQCAKKNGMPGGTVTMGRGTVSGRFLSFFELTDIHREVITMIADSQTVYRVVEVIYEQFKLAKPNHGIAFTTSVCFIDGTKRYPCRWHDFKKGADQAMFQAITVIVDRGRAEDVIDAAVAAGSQGGTIINARGSGIHETTKLFGMEVEPEKEMVLILTESERAEKIVQSIRETMQIEEPGQGILYIQHINQVYGLYR